MELRFIGFILLIHASYICRGEDPGPPGCTNEKPFRLSDNTCANFTDICLKNNIQCQNFQTACKQCPPSNYSVIMYIDIMNLKNQLNTTNKNLEDLRNKFLLISNRNPEKTNNILILCSVIIALSITLNLLFLIEYRFKIITKCCQLFNQKNSKYHMLLSRKRIDNDEIMDKINKLENLQHEFQDYQKKNHQELLDQFKKYQIFLSGTQINSDLTSNDIKLATIQFQFDDVNQEPIELYVHNYQNIVQVKQLICAKLPHAKPDDYKIMKLKYNGKILDDDNQYLLENIDKSNAIVNCFIDSSMNASDIVVVKLQGKILLPEIIQISKTETIEKLKESIGIIIKSKEFSLFKEVNNNNNNNNKKYKLINSETINELQNKNLVHVILEKKGKLVIKSIFDDNTSISVDYVNTDPISMVIEKIQNKFISNKDNFILFYKNEHVEESKYLFEFEVNDEFAFKMCNIAKFHGIKNENKSIEMGGFWELYYAIVVETNNKILLKKYKNIDMTNWKTKEIILNELKLFTKTKLQPRFIQLTGIYINGTALYVTMEHMAGGTLNYYLKNNNEQEIVRLIINWIKQIVDGLKFLHNIKIIHRDLNPSNILVDENVDLKLSSFNLSKYERECNMSSVGKKEYIGQIKVRYMAPELLAGESYGVSCDIWSLGAVLVRVVSGKRPFYNVDKLDIISKVKTCDTIDYKISNESYEGLKQLIDSCLLKSPVKRCTLEDLLKSIN